MSVHISRGPTDPICPRVSVGGNSETGFYCVFRGPADDCIAALEQAIAAMRTRRPSLDTLPVDRKFKELGGS